MLIHPENTGNTFQNRVHSLFYQYKFEDNSDGHLDIPIKGKNGKTVGCLSPLQSRSVMDVSKIIPILSRWRDENNFAFANQPKVTVEGTSRWYDSYLINQKDRILFLIKSAEGKPIGHLGLWHFDFDKSTCELDNLIKGEKKTHPGIMTFASKELIKWTYKNLGVKYLNGTILKDNVMVIKFWENLGFHVFKEIPLAKIERDDMLNCWAEILPGENKKVDRYEVVITNRNVIENEEAY